MLFYNGSVALVKDDLATHLDYLTEATILSEAIYDGNEMSFCEGCRHLFRPSTRG